MKPFKTDEFNKYIDKCIDDAKTATLENYTDEVKEMYADTRPEYGWVLIGKDLIFVAEMFSTTPRINQGFFRRLIYRLTNNVQRNFGVEFNAPTLELFAYDGPFSRFRIHNDKDFPWDKAVGAIKMPSGKIYVVCHDIGNRPHGWDVDNYPGDALRAAGLDTYVPYTYGVFYWAYIHAFGSDPTEMFLKIVDSDGHEEPPLLYSEEHISQIAADDLKNHGCCYFSACSMHCAECKKECRREKKVMRDGISTKRWKELHLTTMEINAGKWQV